MWRDFSGRHDLPGFPNRRDSGSLFVYNVAPNSVNNGEIEWEMDWTFEKVGGVQQTAKNFLEMTDDNTNLQTFNLNTHGCNCPDLYDEFAIGGENFDNDPVDEICQA